MNPPPLPRVVLPAPEQSGAANQWLVLSRPRRILAASEAGEVPQLLREVDSEIAKGNVAAGFVCYEAAPAFDMAQTVRPLNSAQLHPFNPTHSTHPNLPLAWMMVCDAAPLPQKFPACRECVAGKMHAGVSDGEYFSATAEIQKRIADGDVYQVNHTYPMRARFAGDPLALFAEFARAQFSPWMFFAETDEWAVCSASPECFFLREGGRLESRPMKGTRPPEAADELQHSEKDRAENLMIVDMVRNDMSRIAGASDVRAGPLLRVETHPTVAQMTSSVKCDIPARAGLAEIFAALFPCASVTGAPKVAAMRVISELEKSPRGAYCGACGFADGKGARFSVAIRTAVVRKDSGGLTYGVGGGIVADSSAEAELEETRVKASLFSKIPRAVLIETARVAKGRAGLLARHLARLSGSARRLGFECDAGAVRAAMEAAAAELGWGKLRLTLGADGVFEIEAGAIPKTDSLRVGVSDVRVCSGDELLRRKTNRRAVYDAALAEAKAKGWDDAILRNERGELTETCVANVAAEVDGRLLTPAAECGLLPGVLRAEMLARGELREVRLTAEDLRRAGAVFRLNSVRGMELAELVE